jgi:hypothetical protein
MLAAALVACGPAAMMPAGDGGNPQDSGPACMYPEGPYGNQVGQPIRPYEYNRCDGTPYSFSGPDFCTHEATLVIAAAGW